MSHADPLTLFCDESGSTGARLLDPDQRIYTYAAVEVGDDEAWRIIRDVRSRHLVLGEELKARDLLKSATGKALVIDVLTAIRGRYSFVAFDKLLALCCKVFEYIYEPVFQDDPGLLYRKNLHRFVAMYCYTFFVSKDERGEEAVRQFEQYMRFLDPALAPLLFEPARLGDVEVDNPFGMVTRFAQAYRDEIIADNAEGLAMMTDRGKWTLDLAASGLWSFLNHWGGRGRPLRVICDNSRPLQGIAGRMTGDAGDPGIQRARELFGDTSPLGYTLSQPIAFEDSRNHPGLQLADLVAGAAATCLSGDIAARGLEAIAASLEPHVHPHSTMPDFAHADIKMREPTVNWLMLYELADRAEKGGDRYALLPEMYAVAERMYDAGEVPSGLRPS